MANEATKTALLRSRTAPTPVEAPPSAPDWHGRLKDAVARAARYLLSLQKQPGYWIGELEADTTLESDYIFFLYLIGKADPVRIALLANTIRREQLPDGGWSIYAGGPSELNATIKAYFSLKLAGDSSETPHMLAARKRALALGGLERTNSYTRFYFALCGKIDWGKVPAMPPELMLLPRWFFVNVYEMSSWTRGILVPLTILFAHKPDWRLPERAGVDELWRDPRRAVPAFKWDARPFSWHNFFRAVDRVLKLYEALPWKPLRKIALRRSRRWLLEHLERSEGMGAIYPAMVNAVLALVAMGYAADHPLTARERGYLAQFEIEEDHAIRLQPCLPPVWDTALAMVALEQTSVPSDHPALVKAATW
ncbi:MAG: squalene--hopene cyclase, partial [Terriglobia bacterium]